MGPWREEIRSQFRLALPVVIVQVGLMAMAVVDTAMMGRHSAVGVAATSMGHSYFFIFLAFGLGALMALDPIVSQAFGAKDDLAITRGLQRGLILALSLSVPVSVLMLPADWVLTQLGQPPDVVTVAADFSIVSIPGAAPFLIFVVLRQTLQAMHRLRAILAATLVGNVANVFLNWVFIFGNLGSPQLGAVGSAWATVICRWLMVIFLLVAAWPILKQHLLPWRADALDPLPLWRMLRLGAPIGLQFQLEIGGFWAAALFMGMVAVERGADILAGHHLTMNVASLTFMVPLGVSAAASVRVGHFIGRGDMTAVRRASVIALFTGLVFMSTTALAFIFAPAAIASLYAPGLTETLAVAAVLIPVAGAFQIFDGIQVVASGILRGIGDTRFPMLVHVAGFWVLGVPLGAWLTFSRDVIPTGPWWGMVLALVVVAATLVLRVRHQLASSIGRLVIDDPRDGPVWADPAPEPVAAGADPAGPSLIEAAQAEAGLPGEDPEAG